MPEGGIMETVAKGGVLAGAIAVIARGIFSWAKRLGLADSLSAAEAAHRNMLKADMDELRARLSKAEETITTAREKAAEERLARMRIEIELTEAKREITELRDEVATLRRLRGHPPGEVR
jgi:chromosome segregation ATPase